jgi:hypothetical protein
MVHHPPLRTDRAATFAAVRWWPLALAGIAAVFVSGRISGDRPSAALAIVGLCLFLATALGNLRLPGMVIIGFGVVLNVMVIAANNGMPVLPNALVDAGVVSAADSTSIDLRGHRHLEDADSRLTFLDDRIPLRPVHAVVSIGDVVLAIGLVVTAASLIRRVHHSTPLTSSGRT